MMSEDLQYINRGIEKQLPTHRERKIVLITGARQTGKTTLAKHVYPTLKYINLDAPENREILREVFSSRWHIDVGVAILDEAQKEPIIFEKIKYAFDEKKLPFTVILGSSQILLIKKIRESLAGRIWIYELWPFLLSELTENFENILLNRIISSNSIDKILHKEPSSLFEQEANLKLYENFILKWGSMPSIFYLKDENDKKKWLKDYSYTYLERDLSDLARLDDLSPFRKFQKLSALRCAQLLNYSDLARDTGISVDTARRYLEYLKISYQVILLYPYYKNLTSSVIKTPKIYWIDIGLLRHLTGNWNDLITGKIFETMVISEIYKYVKTYQNNINLYFYRTRSGMEVDLIIEYEDKIFAIEIKNRNKIVKSDYKNLKVLSEKLKKRWGGGIIVYRGNKIEKIDEPSIWCIPSYRMIG